MSVSITQQGQLNTAALVVPGLYIQIVSPQNIFINGQPSNVLGIVGTASWGPLNKPTVFSGQSDYQPQFGPTMARKYDMGTAVAIAQQQGANNFLGVRVSDGTDVAASIIVGLSATSAVVGVGGSGYVVNDTITVSGGAVFKVATVTSGAVATVTLVSGGNFQTAPTGAQAQVSTSGAGTGATLTLTMGSGNGATLSGKYSGSTGNATVVSLSGGSAAGSTRVVVSNPVLGLLEVFDNITGSGNAFWVNLVAAINSGVPPLRGPSAVISATVGTSTGAPSNGSLTLAGGTDGATTITAAVLVGSQAIPRTGMYQLPASVSVMMLADADDSTQWSVQDAYCKSIGAYAILVTPAGDTVSSYVSGQSNGKTAAGLDDWSCKLLFGDWLYWYDQYNKQLRLVSPQAFSAGVRVNLAPNDSVLNKQLVGIVGSQKSGAPGTPQTGQYSSADISTLVLAGLDVIGNPAPGGAYWAHLTGHNASSVQVTQSDSYTTMTNFIATSLAATMGIFVGKPITPQLLKTVRGALLGFFSTLQSQGLIGTLDGSPAYGVTMNATNNPQDRTALGYMQADCQVVYFGIAEKFICNVQGGASVTVTQQTVGGVAAANAS